MPLVCPELQDANPTLREVAQAAVARRTHARRDTPGTRPPWRTVACECVGGTVCAMVDDDSAKANLYGYLRHEGEAVLAKLDGLSEYAVRRPLTATGTNLLGLVKHLTHTESRYFGEIFDRPYPEPLAPWDDDHVWRDSLWVTEHETREEIID